MQIGWWNIRKYNDAEHEYVMRVQGHDLYHTKPMTDDDNDNDNSDGCTTTEHRT